MQHVDLTLVPKPQYAETIENYDIKSAIEEELIKAGKQNLLNTDEMRIEIEDTFPVDAVIVVGFTFLSGVALETYKSIIIPLLKKRFGIREEKQKD